MGLEDLRRESFLPHVGTVFVTVVGEQTVELRLSAAEALPGARPGQREPFSLIFVGPVASVLPQRIYALRHDQLGALDIFLVPIGPGAGGMRYEAVFN